MSTTEIIWPKRTSNPTKRSIRWIVLWLGVVLSFVSLVVCAVFVVLWFRWWTLLAVGYAGLYYFMEWLNEDDAEDEQ